MKTKLGNVTKFAKGSQINGSDLSEDFAYPFLNGGVRPSGRWKAFNVKEHTVTISEGGNSCGYVNFMQTPFWCGAHCYYLYDAKCDEKYLFYALKSQERRLMCIRSGCCMPNIKKSDLAQFELNIEDDRNKQAQVVHKLDSISYVVEQRKTQLAQLDQLVKSRFVEAA